MQLDEDLLIEYALGILERPDCDRVDQALAASAALRERLAEMRESLDTLALAETPQNPPPALWGQVLDSLEPEKRFMRFVRRFAELFDLPNLESRKLLEKIDTPTAMDWKKLPIPGVRILKFQGGPRVAKATCGLVAVRKDTVFPRHRHQDQEWLFVLQGSAVDDQGHQIQPGDYLVSGAGSEHAFKTLGPDDFVFAVLLEKDLEWLLIPSLIDRVFGRSRFRVR